MKATISICVGALVVGQAATSLALEGSSRARVGAPYRANFQSDGRFSMSFPLVSRGRTVQANLVGTLRTSKNWDGDTAKFLHEPRIQIGGRRYLVSDNALRALLSRAGGYYPEHGFSGQTRVFGQSLGQMLGALVGLPRVAHFDGKDFRLVRWSKAGTYYHDNYVAIAGPGLPQVSY